MSQTTRITAMKQTGPGLQQVVSVDLPGRLPVGYVFITGATVDHNTVVVNGRTYEFVTTLATAAAGSVEVDIVADQTADYAAAAFVTAVNADAGRSVDALGWNGNADGGAGVTLVGHAEGLNNLTLVETLANGTVSAALTTGATTPTPTGIVAGTYAVTAANVTALAGAAGNEVPIAAFATNRPPTLVSVMCLTSAGAIKAITAAVFTLRRVNQGVYALLVEDGAAILADTNSILFILTIG